MEKKKAVMKMKNICMGCSACANICPKKCIDMKQDANGFSYPEIDEEKCIECGICLKTCPLNKGENTKDKIPMVFAAYSKDEEMRMESSSGGIFSEIAQWVIQQQGVVYGATYNDEMEVVHICIEKEEDLYKVRGAKYSESKLGTTFIDILEYLNRGVFVLFSGMPCQVAGLKAFLPKEYENLICIDFVCHGIPSPMVWKEYLKLRMKEDQKEQLPSSINLRFKITGWSRYQYSNEFSYPDGAKVSFKNGESLFMKLFVGDYINRTSCSDCRFKGYRRISDFTIGDFWGIWDIDPTMDDNKGTSLVLLQSEKAQWIWKQIHNKVIYKEVALKQASQQNSSLLQSSKAKTNREEILELIRNGEMKKCYDLLQNNCKKKKSINILKRIFRKFH